jgi:hypothetical protein
MAVIENIIDSDLASWGFESWQVAQKISESAN